jgi:hypothetical protein
MGEGSLMSSCNISLVSNAYVGKAFNAVVNSIGRNDLDEILFNWNESRLNEDGHKIICYPGRDGRFSRGKESADTRPALMSSIISCFMRAMDSSSVGMVIVVIFHLKIYYVGFALYLKLRRCQSRQGRKSY